MTMAREGFVELCTVHEVPGQSMVELRAAVIPEETLLPLQTGMPLLPHSLIAVILLVKEL